MPRPISGRQIDKLGDRLIGSEAISDDDLSLLAEVMDAYRVVLDQVDERLRQMGFQATTRLKTTGTLLDKLRRATTLKLNAIHDVAGARITIDGGRLEQNRAVERIAAAFPEGSRPPITKDRRESPSFGYRAVHVIVFLDSVPVEIQVRTKAQNTWAQIVEKLGDRWGRGLRYGSGPDRPGTPAINVTGAPTRAQVMDVMIGLSEMIDHAERTELDIKLLHEDVLALDPEDRADLADRMDKLIEGHNAAARQLMAFVDRVAMQLGIQDEAR